MTAPIVGPVFPGTFSRIAAYDSPPGSAGDAGVCAGKGADATARRSGHDRHRAV